MAVYVSGIQVVFGTGPTQIPSDAVKEFHNKKAKLDNINHKFKRLDFAWLVAETTYDPNEACNSFEYQILKTPDPALKDICKGYNGKYRYLIPFSAAANPNKITEVRLLRLSSSIKVPPAGYDGMTIDINKGRCKDYLYLIWKYAPKALHQTTNRVVSLGSDGPPGMGNRRKSSGATTSMLYSTAAT